MGWQMIKITVDQKVYEALQKAFPKPANTAHRALAKYISVLEAMLFKSLHFAATPLQRKLDLFAILAFPQFCRQIFLSKSEKEKCKCKEPSLRMSSGTQRFVR
jgi:hypothetical protein